MPRRALLENLLLLACPIAVAWPTYHWGYRKGWNAAIPAVIDAKQAATRPAR